MNFKKKGSIVHIATAFGVLVGGIVWALIYESRFGSIEFNGPASLGMGIGLIGGGIAIGVIGVAHDLKYKESFMKTFGVFIASITVSALLIGAVLGSYAQNKWDYAAAHESECQEPESVRPLAC